MRARFSSEATTDLGEIAEYIRRDSPRRARSFVRDLRACALDIAGAPEAFAFAEGQAHRGSRRRVFSDYLIFYRTIDGRLEILRIVHGARDHQRLLDNR